MRSTYPVLQELNPDRRRASGVGSLSSLIWLTLGAFAIGTEGFMIAGLLPALARDLNVGLPAAGHLVTAFSLAYAIGAPAMAVSRAGLERRRLLAAAMGGFALANLLAALAPGYIGLLAARLLLALSAATFMPAASGYAAALGGPERRGPSVHCYHRVDPRHHRRRAAWRAGGAGFRLARHLFRCGGLSGDLVVGNSHSGATTTARCYGRVECVWRWPSAATFWRCC